MKRKILVAFIVCGLPATALASPIGDIPGITVSNHYASAGWEWDSGYDISFNNQNLVIDINIKLQGLDPGDALRASWKTGIENIWGKSFDIFDGTYYYDTVFNVHWVDSSPHQVVTVVSGFGYTSAHDWGIGAPASSQPSLAAHEVGHFFGLWDEYVGGPVDPVNPVIRPDSLMSLSLGKTYPDHYNAFTGWLASESGRSLSLVPDSGNHFYGISPVPEPSTYLMLGSGLVGLGFMGRRRRSTKAC